MSFVKDQNRYASICANFWSLSKNWGWDAVENKFNPCSQFEQVHIICLNDKNRYQLHHRGTLCIHRIPLPSMKLLHFPIITTWKLACYAKKIIIEQDIPLITQFYQGLLDSGHPTVLAAEWTNIPSIVTVQNDYHQLFRTRTGYLRSFYLNNLLEAFVYEHATHIRCVSPHLVQYVLDHGISEKKISFVPRCIDLSSFGEPTEKDNNNFKKKHGLINIQGRVVILIVAKLLPQKNLKRTLRAFSSALSKGNPLQLLIAGDGKLLSALKKTAKDFGIDEHVTFLGKIPQTELCSAYKISDVFLLASLFEGRSRAVLEALSFGLPIICSNINAMQDIVEQNFNGMLVDPFDTKAIAEAITRLAEDKLFRNRLSQNAIKGFLKNYSTEKCYKQKAGFIKRIMASLE